MPPPRSNWFRTAMESTDQSIAAFSLATEFRSKIGDSFTRRLKHHLWFQVFMIAIPPAIIKTVVRRVSYSEYVSEALHPWGYSWRFVFNILKSHQFDTGSKARVAPVDRMREALGRPFSVWRIVLLKKAYLPAFQIYCYLTSRESGIYT